jgi:hypothetical protein
VDAGPDTEWVQIGGNGQLVRLLAHIVPYRPRITTPVPANGRGA